MGVEDIVTGNIKTDDLFMLFVATGAIAIGLVAGLFLYPMVMPTPQIVSVATGSNNNVATVPVNVASPDLPTRNKGRVYTIRMNLPVNGNVVYLDFVEGNRKSVNVPAGSTLEFPHEVANAITIINDSNAADIYFTLNASRSFMSAKTPLFASEEYRLVDTYVNSLAIRAISDDTTVTVLPVRILLTI